MFIFVQCVYIYIYVCIADDNLEQDLPLPFRLRLRCPHNVTKCSTVPRQPCQDIASDITSVPHVKLCNALW